MSDINKETELIQYVLATDLDGTLIPLPDSQKNKQALAKISEAHALNKFTLIFCTGRHFSSVIDAITEHHLPKPDWIICDVGTSIHQNVNGDFPELDAYNLHLQNLTLNRCALDLKPCFENLPGLDLQIDEHQKQFKLCYECKTELLDGLMHEIKQILETQNLPYAAHGSLDPFLNCGLIDILPHGVSKAYALKWLENDAGYNQDQVIYAGDSGNDYSALTSGCRAIVVSNASKGLPEKILNTMSPKGQTDKIFLATQTATSGVLEGCQYFDWDL